MRLGRWLLGAAAVAGASAAVAVAAARARDRRHWDEVDGDELRAELHRRAGLDALTESSDGGAPPVSPR